MILPTPKIEKAIRKAAFLHRGQTRKDDERTPYVMHPFCVALILINYTDNEDVIAAGLLHDTVEDNHSYSLKELDRDFGVGVYRIVEEVTLVFKNKTRENWLERKKLYLRHLDQASIEGLMVCAADKLHDMRTTIFAYRRQGDKLWKKFRGTPQQKSWFYQEIYEILKKRLNNPIVDEYRRTLAAWKKISSQY